MLSEQHDRMVELVGIRTSQAPVTQKAIPDARALPGVRLTTDSQRLDASGLRLRHVAAAVRGI